MTTKTIKTVFFVAIIGAMILPLNATNFAVAEISENTTEKIPDKVLLERSENEWKSQYADVNEFREKQEFMQAYVTEDFKKNGWNEVMVENNIIITNFDTIIGEIGNGYELVALYAAKDNLLGSNTSSEPVTKFHKWLLSQYDTPSTVEEINSRIAQIVPQQHIPLTEEYVNAFNKMADHGNVPLELIQQDVRYWNMVSNVAVCQYDENCDLDGMKRILDNETHKIEQISIPILDDIVSFFFPEVWASTDVWHTGYVYGTPLGSCDYGTCARSDYDTGVSPFNLTIESPSGGHSYGDFWVYASTCSTASGATDKVTGTLDKGTTHSIWGQGNPGCGISDIEYGTANPNASYLWTVTTTHSAWT